MFTRQKHFLIKKKDFLLRIVYSGFYLFVVDTYKNYKSKLGTIGLEIRGEAEL